jgi:hypothetical protein
MRTFVLCLLLIAVPSSAQEKKGAVRAPSQTDLLTRLPSALTFHSTALGARVLATGKEKTVLNGRLFDEKGKPTAVKLTLQLPGLMLLEGLSGPALKFDGATPTARNSRLEEALLETFISDTAEGMLTAIKDGAAVHLLGRRVAPDPSVRGNASPPLDVFDVTGPVRSSAAGLARLKRYFFDSESGLLASTQYTDETFSPPMNIETRFSDWRRVDGSAYAGHVERLENGRVVFSLTVDTINAAPKQDPASFR